MSEQDLTPVRHEIPHEDIELTSLVQLDRLDAIMRTYFPLALSGDYAAADIVLTVIDLQARIVGTFAATRIEISSAPTVSSTRQQRPGRRSPRHTGCLT